MAARRQINRYREEPFGRDYADVLKRGKAFHRYSDSFMMTQSRGGLWLACFLPAFGIPDDAIIFTKKNGRWVEKSKEEQQ